MRRITFLLLLVSAIVAAGCHHMGPGVRGSGNRVMQKREIGDFKSISSQGAFDIRVVCQQPLSLEIEGDDNIVSLVSSEVSGGVLYLKSLRDFSVNEPIVFRISVPNLEAFAVSGAGKIDISGLNSERFEIDANGAPNIRVAGLTKIVDISSNGAAKIDTQKLQADRAIVDSKGVSKIDVDVKDRLDVTISGPSQVTYEGDPVVNKTIHGPGKLERKASEGT
jgi:Putative auto-transporter adhesin, head GIN domain